MGMLGSVILSVCVGTAGDYQPACNNALDAGVKQYGIDRDFDLYQRHSEDVAKRLADQYVGEKGKSVVGGFIFIAKTAADKKLVIGLPKLGLSDRVQSEFTPNSALLSMLWRF